MAGGIPAEGLVAPYLTLLPEDAGQQAHPLREVFNGLRYIIKTGAQWRWIPPLAFHLLRRRNLCQLRPMTCR